MSIVRAAIVGGGVIGAGWAARLIENAIAVTVFDPAPDAQAKMQAVLDNAAQAYAKLTMAPRRDTGTLRFAADLAEAVADADLIVESVPERLDIKRSVYADIEAAARPDALIASSTSGIMPTDLQAGMTHPGRLLVAHPFNPVYLLPVVEIVGGKATDPGAIQRAMDFYPTIGMKPVHITREIEAFVADRLLESLWRESLWLIKDGICTTQELDDIIRYGFGLRFAQMGIFETYRVAGGEAGMRHFMAQFGPCLSWPWSHLTDVPDFNDELVDLIADQSDAQSGHHTIRELERIRDENLVAIQQALKANDWGAGQVLAEYERRLFDGAGHQSEPDLTAPIRTTERRVPPDWTDYNNHMNEARYLQAFADATDAFLRMIGCDADYIASGGSYFTVETHIRHLAEVAANEPILTETQVIAGAGKKLHLFHWLKHADGRLLATGEHMLVHVSLQTRAATEPAARIAKALDEIAQGHARLPAPDGLGRAVGQGR
ncbi:carnitine 3-dehydrogenase [Paracoccus sp. TK19116]|uniref:L-carnitine dehydrogenase n=1 Tax=Paracoccus albicereus TaxID=2922394 RepID=A0ABT1MSX8_9RHOB|nr:carnitine 3-dehydrogenase [Paracoccus albicereus]MCQ0971422.1 carnitine 3-dehydrogenase [Paracoccus albicereus]